MKKKIIDLFCGCGGMSRGFEMAGFEVALAIDFWKDAIATYRHNSPGVNAECMDIHDLDETKMREYFRKDEIVGIIGGPPCQGFSTVGKREVDDPRNQLYLEYCRIVKVVSPEFFVIENVKGLTTLNDGAVKEDIVNRFAGMGYNVSFKILNAANFGVPQNRNRVFFVGMKKGFFEFPKELDYILSAKEGISDLPSARGWDGMSKITAYSEIPQNEFQRLMRGGETILRNHDFTSHSEQTVGVINQIPDGGSIRDLPPEFWQIRKYNKAFERMSSRRPANTVDTGHRNYFHYAEPRIPTVRENARLQSFPDSFEILGTRGSQYKQVGNAVPPLLAKAVADEIMSQLHNPRKKGVAAVSTIRVANLPSPGASFTDHTDETVISCYDYVASCTVSEMSFKKFQEELLVNCGVNKSNLRCILPMLRYAGLIEYDKNLKTSSFFTGLGKQYVSVVKLLKKLRDDGVPVGKEEAAAKAKALKAKFLRYALATIIGDQKCKYGTPLLWMVKCVDKFGSIDKREFACLAYGIQSGGDDPLRVASPLIESCRAGKPVNVKVAVRHDAKNGQKQLLDMGWLVSYTYLTGLLEQAGIIKASGAKFDAVKKTIFEIKTILEK